MESQPTPRITAPYLDSYQGRNVIVVGRVAQLRGEVAVIDADGNITAHLNRVCDDLFQLFVPSQPPPPLSVPYHSHASFTAFFFVFGPSQLILGHPNPTGSPPFQWQRGTDHRQGQSRPVHPGAKLPGPWCRRRYVSPVAAANPSPRTNGAMGSQSPSSGSLGTIKSSHDSLHHDQVALTSNHTQT